MKTREVEKLREEAKKKEKSFDDKLNLALSSNKQLNEQNLKLKSDMKRMADENASIMA